MSNVFQTVEQEQCPECKYLKRCPARRILHDHPDDRMVMDSIMRNGFCSQYEQKPKPKKSKEKESGNAS